MYREITLTFANIIAIVYFSIFLIFISGLNADPKFFTISLGIYIREWMIFPNLIQILYIGEALV
ncbi:MAG TPA: hypothetical protein DDZ81_22400 [Acetobacteraceae bacterium]|nr:hypothetical protein [Acetobacteraceae bacterium]